jgi:hypothetical protein
MFSRRKDKIPSLSPNRVDLLCPSKYEMITNDVRDYINLFVRN